MKKLTDQDLDSLFKNASENFPASFDAAEWEKMTAKLDQSPRKISRKALWFSTGALLIFLGGVWVGLQLSNKTESVVSEMQHKETTQNKEATTINSQPLPSDIIDQNKVFPTTSTTASSGMVVQRSQIDQRSQQSVVESFQVLPDFQIQDQRESITSENSNSDPEVMIFEEAIQADAMRDSSTLSEYIHAETADSIQQATEPEKEKGVITRQGISVRAIASPDFSSINFSSTKSIGTNFGILLEYHFSNSFSIASGAIWSLKKYSSNKELTYSGYSTNNLVGTCRILEVPVTLYYHLPARSKGSFYVGAGTSSYIMLREDYTYVVDYTYSSHTYQSRVERKNNEWFKIVNLSVGWQHHLSPKFDLLVEPFVRIPLTGVGEGNVQLSSMGTFIGLNYNLK